MLGGLSFFFSSLSLLLSLRDICNSIKLKRKRRRVEEKREGGEGAGRKDAEDDVAESAFVSGSGGVKR